MKSLKECIRTLVMCAGGDGNLLLNVGPMPTGEIEPRQVERLKEMGTWLKVNGESIYGTRGGPIPPQSWGVTTHKNNVVYLHVLSETDQQIAVPQLEGTIRSVKLLSGREVEYVRTKFGTIVKISDADRDPYDTVIVVSLER
jgi:alpha-L-fucosidase